MTEQDEHLILGAEAAAIAEISDELERWHGHVYNVLFLANVL